jgi:hypothetical protein
MATKSRSPARQEAVGEKLTSENGSSPELGTFAVWKALTTKWHSPQKLNSEFRRRFGKESRIRSAGARLYLITEEQREAVLEEVGRPVSKLKKVLDREVTGLDSTKSMAIADFDISDPDEDGNKALSLVLEVDEDSEGQHPQEARDKILEGVGAGGLVLPDLDLSIEVGFIAGKGSRRDFKPVMNAHMPRGETLSFGGALLMHKLPQPSVSI